MAAIVRIETEDDAWRVLSDILNDKINADEVALDFGEAKWAKFCLNFKGSVFQQTVTASMMRGLVEYQKAFYRAAALLTKNDARIIRLTDKEKDELELIFKVKEGSSELNADASEQLKNIVGKCVDKMSGKQIQISIIVVALLFFGNAQMENYLSNDLEKARIEASMKEESSRIKAETRRQEIASTERRDTLQLIEGLMRENKRKTDLLEQAFEASEVARRVGEFNGEALDEILRNSSKADELTIQGITLNKYIIRELTRSQRSSSKNVMIKEKFLVVAVESQDNDSFVVRLERLGTGEVIIATLDDPLVSEKHHKAIQKAEWSRQPVMVHVSARKVGETYKDAKIMKASTPRKSS